MINNTNAISVSANSNFDMTALMELLKANGATVIIINNGNAIDISNIIDSTTTETGAKVIEKKRTFNYDKYITGRFNGVLSSYDIKVKTGKGGAQTGHISSTAYKTLLKELKTKKVSLRKVRFLFETLDEAGYKKEGRGLKNDVLFEVLRYIKENDYAKTYGKHGRGFNKKKERYDMDNLVEKLTKIPFTNDFAIKFANCLKEGDEVAYATFELVDVESATVETVA